jgi:hypothetical protein
MQLVAYGAQDVYLTGNPQITFFKVVYRRHTNFSMESIPQTFNGTAATGNKVTATVSRNGDLVHKMYLRCELPAVTVGANSTWRWADQVGLALINNVELEIGGQRIDKHYGHWMQIWNELSLSASKATGYAKMVGGSGSGDTLLQSGVDGVTNAYVTNIGGTGGSFPATVVNVPLEFWFCRNPGLALPLIALQYHEVKVNIEFNAAGRLGWVEGDGGGNSAVTVGSATQPVVAVANASSVASSVALGSPELYVDYIYLDTDERRRFAQVSHEYLIEQLQFTGSETTSSVNSNIRLNFNHPVKELVWTCQPDANVAAGSAVANDNLDGAAAVAGQFDYQWWGAMSSTGARESYMGRAFTSTGASDHAKPQNPVSAAVLQLNGHDRFRERTGEYFNVVQPFQHHERVPSDKGINVYSFGLKPEEHQPSGTANMSRIDTTTLKLTLRSAESHTVRVYATSYNVLRVTSGMGGLAYSN